MEKKLEYINEGRGGYVVYNDGQKSLKFFFEYGGENCVVIIYVPTNQEWAKKTKRPIEDRQAILTFVAEQSIKDQAPGCYYEISDSCINIFSKE